MNNDVMVSELVASGTLTTPAIIRAFRAVDRSAFVPADFVRAVYDDRPLPLGEGATISQPTTVAVMFELLQPQVADRVLDVGAGSGWTTALLAECVGPNGSVVGTEIVPSLVVSGQEHIAHYANASIVLATAEPGIAGAQFDKILVSASARTI